METMDLFEVKELHVEIRQSSFRNNHGHGIKSMSSLAYGRSLLQNLFGI